MNHVTCKEWEGNVMGRDWERFVATEYCEENGESGKGGEDQDVQGLLESGEMSYDTVMQQWNDSRVSLYKQGHYASSIFSNASGSCFGTPSPFFARYTSLLFFTLTIASAYATANSSHDMGYSRPFITPSRLRFTHTSSPHISFASSSVISTRRRYANTSSRVAACFSVTVANSSFAFSAVSTSSLHSSSTTSASNASFVEERRVR